MITIDMKEMKEYQDYVNLCREVNVFVLPFEENWKQDRSLVEAIKACSLDNNHKEF